MPCWRRPSKHTHSFYNRILIYTCLPVTFYFDTRSWATVLATCLYSTKRSFRGRSYPKRDICFGAPLLAGFSRFGFSLLSHCTYWYTFIVGTDLRKKLTSSFPTSEAKENGAGAEKSTNTVLACLEFKRNTNTTFIFESTTISYIGLEKSTQKRSWKILTCRCARENCSENGLCY